MGRGDALRALERNPLTDAALKHCNDSFTRCTSNPRFLERFYALFMASSDEGRHKFTQTDLPKQRRMLQASFHMMMLAATSDPVGTAHFERLAVLHSQAHLDIPPHLYDLWLNCLVQAVRACDPQCTSETESLWRSMMANGMAFMKTRYHANA